MQLPSARLEVAWSLDPFTRPGDADWSRVDGAPLILQEAHAKRGVRSMTGEIEPSELTLVVDDPDRDLDPANTGSPWYPNVKLRKRARVVVTPADGSPDRVLCTGFLARMAPLRGVATRKVRITLDDIFTVIAGKTLNMTAFDLKLAEIAASLLTVADWPVMCYWPLAETTGRTAVDVAGGQDGTYLRIATAGDASVPYDARPTKKLAWTGYSSNQRVELPKPPVSADWSFTMLLELRIDAQFTTHDEADISEQTASIWRFGPSADGPYVSEKITGSIDLAVTAQSDGTREIRLTAIVAGVTRVLSAPLDVFDDAQSHFVAIRWHESATRSSSSIWVDNEDRTTPTSLLGVAALAGPVGTNIIGPDMAAAPSNVSIGIDTEPPAAWEFTVGRAVYVHTVLTDDNLNDLWEARNAPWDGDTTGERFERLALLAGVDPLDIDVDRGVAFCGPADINGKDVLSLFGELAATEGGAVFATADGQIALRQRPDNDPPTTITYGNADTASVVLHEPIAPDFSLARVINVARVTYPGAADPEIVENADSIADYGELPADITTVARTPAGARAVGQRVVYRSGDPRETIDQVVILATLPRSTIEATLDVEVLDAVLLDEWEVAAKHFVESISHDWQNGTDLVTTLGVREAIVFPTMQWDTAGRGWDVSVWSSPPRGVTLGGRFPAREQSPGFSPGRRSVPVPHP